MADQLDLGMEDAPPRRRRTATLRHAHLQGQPVTVDEALLLEKRAGAQDARVLDVFRDRPASARLTPTQVTMSLLDIGPEPAPLLTSVRRALSNLTRRGLLVHFPRDRRQGPRGSSESTWGLA